MQFTISQSELVPRLQLVTSVVERKQTLPILGNIRLSVGEGSLSLTATDLEIEIRTEVPLTSNEPLVTTIPARKLLDVCRAAPDGATLSFEITGEKAVVRYGQSRFSLSTLPAQDFPAQEQLSDRFAFALSGSALRVVLEKTQFAMAQQDVRYYLNGLMLELGEGAIRGVATDGHRLALCDQAITTDAAKRQLILSRKTVLELLRLLGTGDESEVRFNATEDYFDLQSGSTRVISRLIEGSFPDYQRVIPQPVSQPATLHRNDLRDALNRVSILSNERHKAVRLHIKEGAVEVTASNPEREEAEEHLAARYEGEAMEVGFNVTYLLDALNALDSDDVELHLSDAASSCLIVSPDPGPNRYVIMPLRL